MQAVATRFFVRRRPEVGGAFHQFLNRSLAAASGTDPRDDPSPGVSGPRRTRVDGRGRGRYSRGAAERDAGRPSRQPLAIAITGKAGKAGLPGSMLSELLAVAGGNEDDDDIGKAYAGATKFRSLKEGDTGYVPFDSFRGSPVLKAQLQDVIDLLKNPERYARTGAAPPKGILFCGETGTGKTFAARAVASAAEVPFVSLSGSDFRQSPYSGVGTSMIVRLFAEARKRAPCVVFIDEIDSLGEARRHGQAAAMDTETGASSRVDQETTLNALLAQMDGFESAAGIVFIAATNRPEILDGALLRAGRFERRIDFKLPDAAEREDILRGYASKFAIDSSSSPDFADLARQTSAFTPADIHSLFNDAATRAVHKERDVVNADDFAESLQAARTRKAKARPEGAFQVIQRVNVTLGDVRGQDETVEELRDLVDILANRERYLKLGAVPPRGVLLEGPPGVGKTHCARALAGEVGLPFLSVSGSDFQASKYAGEGTQLVKRLFAFAGKLQPCIVFIDEIDAVGRRRETGARGAEQDRENTLLQLLVELDGFEERSDVLVVAATNRPDALDPALLRPGRFDRRVVLELPDHRGRRSILGLYSEGKPLADDVDLEEVARRTAGLSGAELRNLMNEAALMAAKKGHEEIQQSSVFSAADRIALGAEKKNPTQSLQARRLTAIHEAGHAVLGFAFAHMTHSRVVRASIRPRMGGVGGVTVFERLEDGADGVMPAGLVTRRSCCATLCIDLGGRVAEAVMLQPLEVSSGASADFRSATQRAMAMVTDWGLGGSVLSIQALGSQCSDATLRQVEIAAGSILSDAMESASVVLGSAVGRRCLEAVAEQLLTDEEVDADALASRIDLDALRALGSVEVAKWASATETSHES